MVSSLVAIYFYGNYSSDNQVIYGFGDIFKTYQITLASDVEPDSEEVQWLEKQNVREIFFMTRCEWDSQGLSFSRQQERPLYVYCKKDDTYDYLSFVGRAYFTQEEITQGAQVVIMASIDSVSYTHLDVYKRQEDAVPYERESVDLYQLSLEVADRLKEAAAKKHVSISVQGSKAEVYGARQILSEMIYNLCDNGIKYNNENGKVEVTVGEANNQVVLTVRDNGIGIPPEHQSRVFERFYRVDKSHSKEIGGTGLGLSIVKHGAI